MKTTKCCYSTHRVEGKTTKSYVCDACDKACDLVEAKKLPDLIEELEEMTGYTPDNKESVSIGEEDEYCWQISESSIQALLTSLRATQSLVETVERVSFGETERTLIDHDETRVFRTAHMKWRTRRDQALKQYRKLTE